MLPLINRLESAFGRIILTYIFQIGKICFRSYRSYNQRRLPFIFFSHSSHYIELTGNDIIYKNMLGTKKNLILRNPLYIDRKSIDTSLIIHFLINQDKGAYLSRLLMKDEKPFIKRKKQELIRSILYDRNNFLIFGGRIMLESSRCRIKTIDTAAISSHPDHSVVILEKTIYRLIT